MRHDRPVDETDEPPVIDERSDVLADGRAPHCERCHASEVAKPFGFEIATDRVRSTGAELLAAEKLIGSELPRHLFVNNEAGWERRLMARVCLYHKVLAKRVET